MKKKRSINAMVLRDLGFESPSRFVRKAKKRRFPYPENTDRGLDEVYEALAKILAKYDDKFVVKERLEEVGDEKYPSLWYHLPAKGDEKEYFFLGVAKNRGNISFHIVPLNDPRVEKMLTKELLARRHAESVLNFVKIDRPLFKQLAKAVADLVKLAEKLGHL
jgi:hypothetical protein